MMSLEELKVLREQVKNKMELREKGDKVEQIAVLRVAMATCGIAAGAREIMNFLAEEIEKRKLSNVLIIQGGCMGYCYAEPTIEVKLPGQEGVVYGCVTKERALEILEKHVLGGEMVEGIIPPMHKSLDE